MFRVFVIWGIFGSDVGSLRMTEALFDRLHFIVDEFLSMVIWFELPFSAKPFFHTTK